jgi:hypothetical protein
MDPESASFAAHTDTQDSGKSSFVISGTMCSKISISRDVRGETAKKTPGIRFTTAESGSFV